jgi:hypothetical protein
MQLLSVQVETEFQNLAPGDYSVLAVDRADGLEYGNPEALAPYLGQATHVTLEPEQKLSLKIELTHVAK